MVHASVDGKKVATTTSSVMQRYRAQLGKRPLTLRLHNFTSDSLLSMHLQAGLSALKNPTSFKKENANKDDPLSIKEFQELAADLPYTKHVHSKLLCHITGEIMDEDNPPMVLPNGYVYSLEGFKSIATKYPNGTRTVACPRTGELYDFKDLARAFIA